MVLGVASEVAGAGSGTGPDVLQAPAATRPDNAEIEIDQHGRLRGVGSMAGGTSCTLANDVHFMFPEALVAQDAALHVVALVTQRIADRRIGYTRRGCTRLGGWRLQRAGSLQQVRQVRPVRTRRPRTHAQVAACVVVMAIGAVDEARPGEQAIRQRCATETHGLWP